MNISLDFDDTFTRDPNGWLSFVQLFRSRGHKVYCVTMRYPEEGQEVMEWLSEKVDHIYFTSRQAKKPFMYAAGIDIHVWIDDNPSFINCDALPMIGMNDENEN